MYNSTLSQVGDWMSEKKDECVSVLLDNWPCILTTAVFLLAVTRSRQFWMNIVHVAMLAEAIFALIFPRKYFAIWAVGEPDESHLRLLTGCCILIMFWVLRYWMMSKSSDTTTATSQLWAQALVTCLSLMSMGYSLTHVQKKAAFKIKSEGLSTIFYAGLLAAVGTVYKALNSRDWGGYSELNLRSNIHLRLDFVLLMVGGVTMFALPSWLLRVGAVTDRVDSVHTYMARAMASLQIGMAIMSGRSANFLRTGDKDTVMLVHFMSYALGAVSVCATLIMDWSGATWTRIITHSFWHLLLLVNAFGALDSDLGVFKRILWPSLMQIPRDVTALFKVKNY